MKRHREKSSKSNKLSRPKTAIQDDSYTVAIHDKDDDLFILSDDERNAEEAPIFSSEALPPNKLTPSRPSNKKMKQAMVKPDEKSSKLALNRILCDICLDLKKESELFQNKSVCHHVYCSDCIRRHIGEKIKMNISKVTCPEPKCKGVIGPEVCRSIVPKQVLERWEDALCESLILGSEKFYCPFKDCSGMMVDDSVVVGVSVTSSECPYCHRLFCAQCKVVWHSGLDCREFKSLNLKKGHGNSTEEDNKLMDLAKKNRWKRCPSCNYFVEKNNGCNHIVCRCGYEFCYGCGRRYHTSHACVPQN